MIEMVGWYDRNNCGDEAFKIAHKYLFGEIPIKYGLKPTKSNLILGAGDVVKPFYLDLISKELEYYALGVGLGYESEIELVSSNLKEAFFRNKRDVELAKAHGLKAHYTPDLIFSIDPPNMAPVLPFLKKTSKKTVGIFLTDCLNPSPAKEWIAECWYAEYLKLELARAFDELSKWYEVIFIPMSYWTNAYDVRMNMDIVRRMRTWNGEILVEPFSPLKTIKLISELDLVVGMKFHSLIFSTLVGTPFVNIGLSRKTEMFCLEEGLSNLSIPSFGFTWARFFSAVKNAEAAGVKEKLLSVAKEKKSQLAGVKDHILKNWSVS